MRYRLRWAKRGKLRYLSHHDEAPIFERAARRGGVPVAYSSGFTPRPKIAFGSGLPVGYGSEVELLDLESTEPVMPDELVERYNSGLPDGLMVLGAAILPPGAMSLGVLIDAADYVVDCSAGWVADRLERFMELSSYEVEKPHKGGNRRDDLRKGVLAAAVSDNGFTIRCAIQPRAIRPSDVFSVLETLQGASGTPVAFQRTALLSRREGGSKVLTEHSDDMKVAS